VRNSDESIEESREEQWGVVRSSEVVRRSEEE
jgi:hypothetical protein